MVAGGLSERRCTLVSDINNLRCMYIRQQKQPIAPSAACLWFLFPISISFLYPLFLHSVNLGRVKDIQSIIQKCTFV